MKNNTHTKKDSELHISGKVAGGATGAVVGAVVGGPIGAIIGGVVGTAFGSAAPSNGTAAPAAKKTTHVKTSSSRSNSKIFKNFPARKSAVKKHPVKPAQKNMKSKKKAAPKKKAAAKSKSKRK